MEKTDWLRDRRVTRTNEDESQEARRTNATTAPPSLFSRWMMLTTKKMTAAKDEKNYVFPRDAMRDDEASEKEWMKMRDERDEGEKKKK